MASIQDENGINQGFKPTEALDIRTFRRAKEIVDILDKDSEDLTIVELGCGTGALSWEMAHLLNGKVIGIDISLKFISEAERKFKKDNLQYRVLDAGSKSLVSDFGKVDAIVGNGILHHLYYKLDASLEGFSESLKPGGKIIFWEPNVFNPYVFFIFKIPLLRKFAKLDPDEMAFSKMYISRKLGDSGFEEIRVDCKDFLLPNTPKFLISSLIFIGKILEKYFLTRWLSQSLFISARKPHL